MLLVLLVRAPTTELHSDADDARSMEDWGENWAERADMRSFCDLPLHQERRSEDIPLRLASI